MARLTAKHMTIAISLAGGLVGSSANANDSSAALGAGGLELVTTDAVRLVREDLTIGVDLVQVRYLFRNVSTADFETLVAFPMPAVDFAALVESNLGSVGGDAVNYMDFTVTVNGRPVVPEHEVRATVDGVDIADRLDQFHLPRSGFDGAVYQILESLPPHSRAMLKAEGIALFDEFDGRIYAEPAWTTQTLFYWPQLFPAGAELVIEHSYSPISGASFFDLGDTDSVLAGTDSFWRQFCLDGETLAAAGRAGQSATMLARDVTYILTTANNWAGPIETFHLTIDKGAPDHLVSLCIDTIDKTGPTTFETTLTDFTPSGELAILFIEPVQYE